jgi:TPP-dependent pyruvate/acetoin dehydrogenase alpha subunit
MTTAANPSPLAAGVSPDRAADLYALMHRIRTFEDALLELQKAGKVPGLAQLCQGQEAAVTGSVYPLQRNDWMIATYRGHGHAIAKGTPMRPLMAEMLGKATGCCKGKGGPMHLTDLRVRNPGLHPVVGAHLPIGVGIGMSCKRLEPGKVCLVDFGDGAAQCGTFHESLNLASLWRLPVIFVCENNLYGVSVPFSAASASRTVAERAAAYAMPGTLVDGMDVLAVLQAVEAAIARARRGDGPSLIECVCYRYVGHSQHDPDNGLKYRTQEEIDAWRRRDPVATFRARLPELGVPQGAVEDIEARSRAEVDDAVRFALDSPYPDLAEAYTDVF